MKRRDSGLIDMTPLLDVVFILLFALILNVNVTRAGDMEKLASTEEQLESSQQELSKVLESINSLEEQSEVTTSSQKNLEEDIADLTEQLAISDEVAADKEAMIEAYEASLTKVLKRQVTLSEEDIPEQWLESIEEEQLLLEDWLKYQQIAERYLFIDLRVSSVDGRVYLDEGYTGVNIEVETLRDANLRQEAKEELQYYIFDWLDHKEGGYGFIFVSVVSDDAVKRGVIETLFDSLKGLQTSFDKDRYLINRFVRYQ